MCGYKGSWTSLGGTLCGKNKFYMQKDLCLEWLPLDSLQSSYVGKRNKLQDLCLEGLHVDFWGFTFDSPNLLN
jgi:hypothetical protein